ncbi:MAG: GNAT family N-acetyltransferase [Chloroflexota bacterium]
MKKILSDGLTLRTAEFRDLERVAEFNGRQHEEPGEEGKIVAWTQDLLSGNHPTTKMEDFLLVENEIGEIVSSTCLIPQTWTYEQISFPVSRPELVATDEKWRKKGLVRKQFEVLHQMSQANGDLMQVITGIPWYYRQFGYSHALDLGGSRPYDWHRPGNNVKVSQEDEKFVERPAIISDIPDLMQFYDIHCKNYMINTCRQVKDWEHELVGRSQDSIYKRNIQFVTKKDGSPAGYFIFVVWPVGLSIQEIACDLNISMREFCLFVTRRLSQYRANFNQENEQKINRLLFYLGYDHAAYRALGPQLGRQGKSYAWFIRIPDIPKFLNHIRPVLESRLAQSVMVNHTGAHKVNLYEEHFTLNFEHGAIKSIEPYTPKLPQDGNTLFTRPEFIQLICGHRSYEELNYIHVDCGGNAESAILMDILFPKKPSQPIGIT